MTRDAHVAYFLLALAATVTLAWLIHGAARGRWLTDPHRLRRVAEDQWDYRD